MKQVILKQEAIQLKQLPTWEGWGTSLCWWANRIGYEKELTKQAGKLFFDPVDGIGLSIVRYNIGGGDDPTHNHIKRSDSNIPGYAIPKQDHADDCSYDYDWNADRNQVAVLEEAIRASRDKMTIEAFSNSPPYFMTESGCSCGNVDPAKDNLQEKCYEAFATYLLDVTAYLNQSLKKKGFQSSITSLEPMNEPFTSYWNALSEKQEGCHFDIGESQSRMLTVLAKKQQEKGMTDLLLAGTDETSIDVQIDAYEALSQEAKDAIKRIDVHAYMGTRRAELQAVSKKEKKGLWMSEVDGSEVLGEDAGEMGTGLWLAKEILTDLKELKPTAWILWQVIDAHISDHPNDLSEGFSEKPEEGYWGLAIADHYNKCIIRKKKYYAFGQFTKYIRPGAKLLSSDDNTLMAYDEQESQLTVVLVNDKQQDEDYEIDLSACGYRSGQGTVIRTSGSLAEGENMKELPAVPVIDGTCKIHMPGNAITTCVFDVRFE